MDIKPSNEIEPTAPRLNSELYVIPYQKDQHIVYAPLRRSAFVANTATIHFLSRMQDNQLDRQSQQETAMIDFFKQMNIVSEYDESRPVTYYQGTPNPTSVTLFLTNACNLRCTYCYASAGEMPTENMSFSVAKRGIDFVADNAKKRHLPEFQVNFHGGGEPTVNWSVLTKAVHYAQEKSKLLGLNLRCATATNGVLSDLKIDWILANLHGVSVSFDGLPWIQDTNRPMVNSKCSSEAVMHTIRKFDAAGFNYQIRLTITAAQIPLLTNSVDFIYSNFRPQRIHIEPVFNLGRWKQKDAVNANNFVDQYRKANTIANRYGQDLYISGTRIDTLSNHFCGVSQQGFSLTPSGSVTSCFEVFSEKDSMADKFIYGRESSEGDGYEFDSSVINTLSKLTVDNRDYCQNCFAKWNCSGDCYHNAIKSQDANEGQVSSRCYIIRELTKDQIIDKIRKSGGLFWKE